MGVRRALFTSPRATKRARLVSPVATKRYVQRAIHNATETKYRNTEGAFLISSTTGTNTVLTSVPAGSGKSERTGAKVQLTGLDIHLLARSTNGLRVIVYVPKTATDNMAGTTGFNDGTDTSRYWIWHDDFYAPMGTVAGDIVVNLKFTKKLNLLFASDASTDYEKNPVKLYVSTINQGAAGPQRVDGVAKMWYTDN